MGRWLDFESNPWGQEVLQGVSLELMYLAIGLAVLFVAGHWFWYRSRGFSEHEEPADVQGSVAGLPERIVRHTLPSRIFHWTMAASMLVLLITAFVPLLGLEFAWVTIHWIAGAVLILTIIYHVIHSIVWQDFWSMMSMGANDFREGLGHFRHLLSSKSPEPEKPGKYPFDHRMYHWGIVVTSLAAIVTGVFMTLRIKTPFWEPNAYYPLVDQAVSGLNELGEPAITLQPGAATGLVFVLHGIAGVLLILMVASHIYFAIRPDKRWFTWSMIRGWIDREHYLAHFDPDKWSVGDGTIQENPPGGAIADSTVSAPRVDD
jgi:cytochrome b subunit of formate dehydrogenase